MKLYYSTTYCSRRAISCYLLVVLLSVVTACTTDVAINDIDSNQNQPIVMNQRQQVEPNGESTTTDIAALISSNRERENPYSVKNMRAALDYIRYCYQTPGTFTEYSNTLKIEGIVYSMEISPTDYYVALYPDNSICILA